MMTKRRKNQKTLPKPYPFGKAVRFYLIILYVKTRQNPYHSYHDLDKPLREAHIGKVTENAVRIGKDFINQAMIILYAK
ncbi:MAG: hypothetical protein BWY65_00365 [Firmicutes bacterium ADurb.Bin373]|nr:MAG: hypothetical protein BWY65_00365 [Firmicutes bacterium ADurb.Bin373]